MMAAPSPATAVEPAQRAAKVATQAPAQKVVIAAMAAQPEAAARQAMAMATATAMAMATKTAFETRAETVAQMAVVPIQLWRAPLHCLRRAPAKRAH
jgi:hypothetical protein